MAKQVKIEHIHRANIFLNDRDLIGTVEEVSGLALKYKKKDHSALGMFGTRKVKVGIEALELSLKKLSINSENIDTSEDVKGKIVGDIITKEGGKVTVTKAVIYFRCESAEEVFGSAKATEWSGQELKLDLHAVKYQVGSDVRLEIDIDNDIYEKNGKDMRII